MKIDHLHSWNVLPEEAAEIQNNLRSRLLLKDLGGSVTHVAGADISYSRSSDKLWAGTVILSHPSLETVEERWIEGRAAFPYITGLLGFRELPHVIKTLTEVTTEPDLIFCDGQGIAHPRRLGLASHLGILTGKRTIGCAKSRLVGRSSVVGTSRGDFEPLLENGQEVGAVLTTKEGVRPLFVSPGYGMSVGSAVRWTLLCSGPYRIPEPLRRAHILVNRLRREKGET